MNLRGFPPSLFTLLTGIFLASLFNGGCKNHKAITSAQAAHVQQDIDGNPQSSVYEVKAGDTIEVRLKKNPSYRLHYLLLNEKNLQHTRFIGERYVSKQDGETPMPGAGGTAVYSFRAMSKGIDTLLFGKQPVSNNHPKELAYKLDTLQVSKQFTIKIR